MLWHAKKRRKLFIQGCYRSLVEWSRAHVAARAGRDITDAYFKGGRVGLGVAVVEVAQGKTAEHPALYEGYNTGVQCAVDHKTAHPGTTGTPPRRNNNAKGALKRTLGAFVEGTDHVDPFGGGATFRESATDTGMVVRHREAGKEAGNKLKLAG